MNKTTDDVSIGASARLAAHASGLSFEKLPADTVHAYERTMLDFLTCAISGAAFHWARSWTAFPRSTLARNTMMMFSNSLLD